MPAPEVHLLFHQPIADHSFSANRSLLAVSRDTKVELYKRSGSGFALQDELSGHDKTVTSVDIASKSGKIVTCSQGIYLKLPPSVIGPGLTFSRPQRISLGALPNRLEANPCPPPHQPCGNTCPVVSGRVQVCRWLRSSRHRRLLL